MRRDREKAMFAKRNQTKRGMRVDRMRNARDTRPLTKKNVTRWMKHPNQVDMRNIDTAVKKQQFNARKSKEEMKQKKHEISKINKKIRKTEEKKQ